MEVEAPTEAPAEALDASGVANAAEAAIMLASKAGLDVIGAAEITLRFPASGDVEVIVPGADPVTILAADIVATSDAEEDRASMPPPPPPTE